MRILAIVSFPAAAANMRAVYSSLSDSWSIFDPLSMRNLAISVCPPMMACISGV